MFQVKAKLLFNKRVKRDYLRCALDAGRIAYSAMPGQFVNIKLSDTWEPLLRRPFSINRLKGSRIEILYAVVGKGTEILAQQKAGEYLDVIGPLGKGFDYASTVEDPASTILVAGGMGVAPLVFLAESLSKGKRQKAKGKILVLIGAKTKDQILCEKEFKDLGCSVKIATDNGSGGFKGKVTELLKDYLRAPSSKHQAIIYACGPRPMFKELATISQRYSMLAEVSLEEHLACGIGACLGCVVNTKGGYKRVCKEGPVFNIDEIIW